MHYWNDGYDGWWWMVVMMALVFAVVGAVVWALLHSTRSGSPDLPTASTPEEVLARRLAAGDIDPTEYRERMDALHESRP